MGYNFQTTEILPDINNIVNDFLYENLPFVPEWKYTSVTQGKTPARQTTLQYFDD